MSYEDEVRKQLENGGSSECPNEESVDAAFGFKARNPYGAKGQIGSTMHFGKPGKAKRYRTGGKYKRPK